MKKLLLISFSLLLAINYGLSQSPEKQWLIWNGDGKSGYNPGTNTNIYGNTGITSPYRFTGVSSPNPSFSPPPKNDLLIIYSDGQHFNSRYSSDTGVFFYGTAGPTVPNHNFITTPNTGMQYLYLTNRYEEDDLPSSVRLMAGVIPGGTSNTLGTTTASELTANHDVVFGKDITLIIPNDEALKSIPDSGDVTLYFDGYRPHEGTPVSYGVDFLDLQPVFGTMAYRTMAVYPNPASDPGTGEHIILNPITGPYWYVNLRPNVNINNFPPNKKGEAVWDAVFTLKKGETPVAQIAEPIRLSHDPNFLRVESICQASDGGYMVTYRLQFENDGQGDANSYSAEVTFPPQFDLNCLIARTWHGGGQPFLSGVMENAGRTYTFPFHKHPFPLKSVLHPNHNERIGYVIFTVKVSPPIDVTDVGVSLELINPTVKMDNVNYKVDLFYDLRVCKQDAAPAGSDHQSSNENKDLPEKDGKKAKSVLLSETVGGALHCSRPISAGPCECKKPFCWKCIFWAFGILLIASVLYIFIKKIIKKPIPPKPPLSPNP